MVYEEDSIVRDCRIIHNIIGSLPKFDHETPNSELPTDGIYLFYEDGEFCTNGHEKRRRIVRIGTHRVGGNFRSRINNHYNGNKNSSVFRKHLGGALIKKRDPNDNRLKQWLEQDAPTFQEMEIEVSKELKEHFSFKCIPVEDRQERLRLEEELIATLSACSECSPSERWLGHCAASEMMQKSGLWNTQYVGSKDILTEQSIERIKELAGRKTKEKRALYFIPCCSKKISNEDNLPWDNVRSSQGSNSFQFLDNSRFQMIDFYSNLSKEDAFNYYKNRGTGDARYRKVAKAWQKNLKIPNCRTMKAIERYNGNLYSAISLDVKEKLRSGEIDNVLILSALMGIITPTDLIPDYELMMADKSPTNNAVYNFWRNCFATDEVKTNLQKVLSNFDYVYCLMSTTTGYVDAVAEILADYCSYFIIPQESGQTNKLKSWGKVLSEAILKGYNSPDEMRKVAEMHNCEMVRSITPNGIAMSRYEYPKKRSTDNAEKVMSIRKTMDFGGKKMSQADEIREWVKRNYIEPAHKDGLRQVTINAGEVARQVTGGTNIPNVNNALRGKKLQEMCRIQLIKVEGTSESTTATYIYKILTEGESEIRTEPLSASSIPEQISKAEMESIPIIIRQLAKLKDDGIITEEEFEKKKKELLDRL